MVQAVIDSLLFREKTVNKVSAVPEKDTVIGKKPSGQPIDVIIEDGDNFVVRVTVLIKKVNGTLDNSNSRRGIMACLYYFFSVSR